MYCANYIGIHPCKYICIYIHIPVIILYIYIHLHTHKVQTIHPQCQQHPWRSPQTAKVLMVMVLADVFVGNDRNDPMHIIH